MIGDQDLEGKSGVLGLVEIVADGNSGVTRKLLKSVSSTQPLNFSGSKDTNLYPRA